MTIDFGIRAMSAALRMSDEEFRAAYRNREVDPPDSVRLREPRWSVEALGKELNKRTPHTTDKVVGLSVLVDHLEALQRAECAEEGGNDV